MARKQFVFFYRKPHLVGVGGNIFDGSSLASVFIAPQLELLLLETDAWSLKQKQKN